jgi:hypothetical protein
VILNKFIVVTGSRKEVNMAGHAVEVYDVEQNEWLELA